MNTQRCTMTSLGFALSFALLAVVTACGDAAGPEDESLAAADDLHHRKGFCGNGVCGGSETCSSCAVDCGACHVDAGADSSSADATAPDGGVVVDSGPPTKNNLYVATTGSDSNAGTKAAPFRTLQHAATAAGADTTVHVAAGTYAESVHSTNNGTASGPIRFVSDVRWGAKMVPPKSSNGSIAWDSRGAHVTLDGFEVDGSVDPTSGTKWAVGLGVAGTGSVISHCLVHHIFNTGTASGQGGAGILLDSWYGFNNMQALGNVVHHVGPTGTGTAWYHGIYQTATGVIRNNLVYANSGGGIHLWHDVNHVDIANNTSFGNGHGFIIGGGDYVHTSGPADYITVTNNIAFDNVDIGFDEEGQDGSHNLFTHNLSYQNGRNWRLLKSAHTNDVTANPLFANYVRNGGGNYHLTSASPAIDRGISTYAPAIDFDGLARPRGAAYDLGAYEY